MDEISNFQQDLSNFLGKFSLLCELVHIFNAVKIPKPAFLKLFRQSLIASKLIHSTRPSDSRAAGSSRKSPGFKPCRATVAAGHRVIV
jgi:hypothetical protein